MTDLHHVARLPSPEDNVAIATQTLQPDTTITYRESSFTLTNGVLEGHRFAVKNILSGDYLTSWNQPFGTAIRDIQSGEYVCNANMLDALSHRKLDFPLPPEPTFSDDVPPFVFDEANFRPADPLPRYAEDRHFMGYARPGGRGTGTRNFIVLLGTTSLASGFVRMLEAHLKSRADYHPHIDGIVAVAHTEGGHRNPNNRDLLLRTLAGWMVHPNVGAILAVDYAHGVITNAMLEDFMRANKYPLDDVPHHFLSLAESVEASRDTAAEIVTGWLDNTAMREARPLSELKIALQCGGSDAFSGISGNPLAAWVAKEIIRYNGSANLAETDELISAESYVLDKLPDTATGRRFLHMLDRFQERTGWHGHSISGNPSGGNLYRGLYNIYLKSLGAAAKKHPDLRLDQVIDYAEPMRAAGFTFMDSPGNDLESVTGQVASGCNMIFFVTGNGSITNFPFVPTIKIVTTTRRYELLSNEMDVNAGAYLDGTLMDELGAQTLDLCVDVASGQKSVGEKAGHAQVQIWRDWRLTEAVNLVDIRPPRRDGLPLPLAEKVTLPDVDIAYYQTPNGLASDQIGLILPTSLCAGQIARLTAEQLDAMPEISRFVSRFVALVHTEGCGSPTAPEYIDTLLGYMQHPMVARCLLMEHGCEITHNGYLQNRMRQADLDPADFGWASIQLDGGIQAVQEKIARWFAEQLDDARPIVSAGWSAARIAVVTQAKESAAALARLVAGIVSAGGTVILPDDDPLLKRLHIAAKPTLNYAHRPRKNGLHIMDKASEQWSETLTGLGACGVDAMLIYTDDAPLQAHPFIPCLYVTSSARYAEEVDLLLAGDAEVQLNQIIERLAATLSREYLPRMNALGNVDFQMTRGRLGVSL